MSEDCDDDKKLIKKLSEKIISHVTCKFPFDRFSFTYVLAQFPSEFDRVNRALELLVNANRLSCEEGVYYRVVGGVVEENEKKTGVSHCAIIFKFACFAPHYEECRFFIPLEGMLKTCRFVTVLDECANKEAHQDAFKRGGQNAKD